MTGLTRLTRPAAVALALALGLAAALPARAEMRRYEIDPVHTTVAFLVKHVGYAATLGVFREVRGHFDYDPETRQLGAVRVVVPAASVWTNDERRDGHVRTPDFLDAEAHPEIVFTATGGTAAGEDRGTVAGELTLRGQTRPLALEVTLNKVAAYPFGHGRETVGVSARGTVLRSEWGMSYGVPGGLVADAVEVIVEMEALRAE